MRWTFWRPAGSDTDALDPELSSLFANSMRLPEVSVSDLARGRARVAARLDVTTPPVAGGWLRRRLAWSAAGGGSMWAALLGTAAANKAVTLGVGLSVLLAGAGTAEMTGIGPQVSDLVPGIHSSDDGDGAGEGDAQLLEENELEVQNEGDEHAAVVESTEDAPGNLVTNVRPNGSFVLRALIGEGGATIIAAGGFELDPGDAEIRVPGQPSDEDPDLADYEGYVVLVTGSCEEGDLEGDCTVDVVTILGRAGQGGQPEDAGKPDVLPGNAPEDAGKPEGVGQPDVQPSGGQPAETGKPSDTPGGNPNSD